MRSPLIVVPSSLLTISICCFPCVVGVSLLVLSSVCSLVMNSTSSNSTVTAGWTSTPDGRGTNEIILTCLFTIVLCCWTSVCPNLPALSDGRWAQVRDKLDLTCIGLLGPEFLLMIAVGQRSSARRSVKVCDSSGPWLILSRW